MSLERCSECEKVVNTDMELGGYASVDNSVVRLFYCDNCLEKNPELLEVEDE